MSSILQKSTLLESFETASHGPNSVVEGAFRCVAQFSAALAHQQKVLLSLEAFQKTFELTAVSLSRLVRETGEIRNICRAGSRVFDYTQDAVLREVTSCDTAKPGDLHKIGTAKGGTVLVLVLRAARDCIDLLQFNCKTNPDSQMLDALAAMGQSLVLAWSMRQPGLVTELIYARSRTRQSAQPASETMPILGFENAYGLSKAEFRVCRLLAAGLKPLGIADELGLSIATIRSHLRSIYAKTETSGQIEVVSHIGRNGPHLMRAA